VGVREQSKLGTLPVVNSSHSPLGSGFLRQLEQFSLMDTEQKQLEQIEQLMKNILGSQETQGTVAGTSSEHRVSNGIAMTSNPPLDESSPGLPLNAADGTTDSVTIHFLNSQLYQKLPHPLRSLL
jgi:hypothetical protein